MNMMSSSSSSSSSGFPPDHHHHLSSPTEELCYVHCHYCDTVLAVSVPSTSMFKTVTARCGHCTNLLSVNMRGLQEEIRNAPPSMLINQPSLADPIMQLRGGAEQIPEPPVVNNIDDVISLEAQTTRAAPQRALFGAVQEKVKLLSDKFPVIRGSL